MKSNRAWSAQLIDHQSAEWEVRLPSLSSDDQVI